MVNRSPAIRDFQYKFANSYPEYDQSNALAECFIVVTSGPILPLQFPLYAEEV